MKSGSLFPSVFPFFFSGVVGSSGMIGIHTECYCPLARNVFVEKTCKRQTDENMCRLILKKCCMSPTADNSQVKQQALKKHQHTEMNPFCSPTRVQYIHIRTWRHAPGLPAQQKKNFLLTGCGKDGASTEKIISVFHCTRPRISLVHRCFQQKAFSCLSLGRKRTMTSPCRGMTCGGVTSLWEMFAHRAEKKSGMQNKNIRTLSIKDFKVQLFLFSGKTSCHNECLGVIVNDERFLWSLERVTGKMQAESGQLRGQAKKKKSRSRLTEMNSQQSQTPVFQVLEWLLRL